MDRSKSLLPASALALYVHFGMQIVVGGLLSTFYRADAAEAHASVAAMHRGGVWGLLQGFHYWGSAVMIVHATIHLAATTWAGWYRTQIRAYYAAVALAGLALAFQISGNLLPWDRHGVQTAGVEAAIAARVPAAGPMVARAMEGGGEMGPGALGAWWNAHRLALPILALLAIAAGCALPRWRGPRGLLALPALAAALLAFGVASPFGSAATAADYGRFDAKPSWYTIPMHGLLVWGDRLLPNGGWIGAALVPALFGLALLLLPVARKAKPGRAVLLGFGGLGLAAALSSGGESASLVGTRDPRVRVAPVVRASGEKNDPALAAKGRVAFAAQGCNGCHGEDGLKGVGGPSLKEVWKEHPDADYYVRYVRNPQSVDKGSTMPAFPNVGEAELRAIAEFLRAAR